MTELTRKQIDSMQKNQSGGIGETIKTIVYAVVIAFGVRTFAYEPFNIPSGSMIPTLLVGDYLFVSKFSYGYSRYTVGQRKGLGGGYRRPLYVLGVRPESNEVVVGSEDELLRDEVTISDLNWLAEMPEVKEEVLVQLRYRARAVPAEVMHVGSDVIALSLKEPQRAVTPGQSGVVYREDIVLGGGRIAA